MRSMTGFGQGTWRSHGHSVSVEIRAVNQRHLELKLNLPREYLPWEAELRGLVQGQVARGKVDVAFSRGGANNTTFSVEVNVPLARAYVEAWERLRKELKLAGGLDASQLLARGEMVRVVERRADAGGELEGVRTALERALRAFNRDREREGRALARDMIARVRGLQALRNKIAQRADALTQEFAARLRKRVATLLEGRPISEDRLLQEVALIAERSDVTEELVRLGSHLDALAALPRSSEPAGKKFDFLLQEVHREFNTIASKSADLDVTNATIAARGEIEKLREQAQNVE